LRWPDYCERSILLLWIVLYSVSDEKRHLGSLFGTAIADWAGDATEVSVGVLACERKQAIKITAMILQQIVKPFLYMMSATVQ
jgi:hypothetical protein